MVGGRWGDLHKVSARMVRQKSDRFVAKKMRGIWWKRRMWMSRVGGWGRWWKGHTHEIFDSDYSFYRCCCCCHRYHGVYVCVCMYVFVKETRENANKEITILRFNLSSPIDSGCYHVCMFYFLNRSFVSFCKKI